MSDEISEEAFERLQDESHEQAFAYVKGLNLPSHAAIDANSFSGLPGPVQKLALRLYGEHFNLEGDRLPALIAFSVKYLWFSAAQSAFFMKILADADPEKYTANEFIYTPIGYAKHNGWAYTAYNGLVSIKEGKWEQMLREKSGLHQRQDLRKILEYLALYYYAEASRAAAADDMNAALTALSEAGEATSLADGQFMFDVGVEHATEEIGMDARRTLAKAAANARHAENRAMKQEVFTYLDENPPPPRGKDATASVICSAIAPVAFRTARQWVDEWGKLRSTGTP